MRINVRQRYVQSEAADGRFSSFRMKPTLQIRPDLPSAPARLEIGDKKRKVMIEPVFAQMECNRKFDRFGRRGRSAARPDRRLQVATHNLTRAPLAPNGRHLTVSGTRSRHRLLTG
jgi:hypothetical protein